MNCPECGGVENKVLETRKLEGDNITKRRRACKCGHRFSTFELVVDETLERVMGVRAYLLSNPGFENEANGDEAVQRRAGAHADGS